MNQRKMIERADTGRGSAMVTRASQRIVLAVAGVLAVVLLGALWVIGPLGPQPTESVAPVPGVQPAVQTWFKDREVHQVELNNALVDARKLPRQPGAAGPICARMAEAVQAIAQLSTVPVAALDGPVRAGLDKFDQGAAACLSGDLARAEQLIADGLAQRAAAQDQIDAILDGD